ncbi:hypothetical protein [Azospirillum largimobile]
MERWRHGLRLRRARPAARPAAGPDGRQEGQEDAHGQSRPRQDG